MAYKTLEGLNAWKARTREKTLAVKRAYYEKNRERIREYRRVRREAGLEQAEPARNRLYVRLWHASKKIDPSYKARRAAAHKLYVSTHRDRKRANVNKRTRSKRTQTPAWANQFFISEIYHLAQLRTKYLGEKYVVDHIVPLMHPLVCGLHVENNLRVVPHRVNAAKGNSFQIT